MAQVYPVVDKPGYTPDPVYAFSMVAALRLQQHEQASGKPLTINASTLDSPGTIGHIIGFTKKKGMLAVHCITDAPAPGQEFTLYCDTLDNPIVTMIRDALHVDV